MNLRSGLVAAVFTVAALPAAADAIDGKWCFEGKRLEITGPTIVTPGGNRIQGDYGRHYFTYIVPAGEEGAGRTVDMDQLGEYDMRLWPTGRPADPAAGGAQHWKRCAPEMS